MKTQLLCTFAHSNNLDIVIEYIKQNFTIPENRIFVFENANKQHELYCTYNAEDNGFLDKTFKLDWPRYENSFILTTNPGYKVVELKYFTRISF